MIRIILFFTFIIFFFQLSAQDIVSPLRPPLQLAGNFCENRRNHFHAGVDLRVAGKPDLGVFSVWSGYVSRVRFNAASYGRAVYITHPNGLTSVYGHLDSFSPKIDALVKNLQYAQKTFEIDYILPPDSLKVIAGERIGVAGNSGYSFGAHLHFELRKSVSDEPINPLFLYLDIIDESAPQFKSLVLYVPTYTDCSAWKKSSFVAKRIAGSNTYTISSIINVPEKFALGFELVDFQNSNWSKMQVMEVSVILDDTVRWGLRFDKFNFVQTTACGSLYDSYEGVVFRKDILRTFKETYNNLGFYLPPRSKGIFTIPLGRVCKLKVEAIDANGNKSLLMANLKRDDDGFSKPISEDRCPHHLNPNQINIFETACARVKFDTGSIYHSYCSDSAFVKQIIVNNNAALVVGEYYLPLRKPYNISFIQECLPQNIAKDKWIVVQYDVQKNITNAWRPSKTDVGYDVELNRFGIFSLLADTIAPTIQQTNIPQSGILGNIKTLEITVKDNSTVVCNYSAFLNDSWILMIYDLKSDLFSIDIREKIQSGKNDLRLIFRDLSGNTTVLEKTIICP